jgi:hypothetical protein
MDRQLIIMLIKIIILNNKDTITLTLDNNNISQMVESTKIIKINTKIMIRFNINH